MLLRNVLPQFFIVIGKCFSHCIRQRIPSQCSRKKEFWTIYSLTPIWLPLKNLSGAKLFRANEVISINHMLCFQQELSFTFCLTSWCGSFSSLTFSLCLVTAFLSNSGLCFLVYFIYVHEHTQLGFGILTEDTAVFDCIY